MARVARPWTSADLEVLPLEDGKRYEIIDGELHVSKQPDWHHQYTASRLFALLDDWDERTGAGAANNAPGVIFAEDNDVAPDVVWASTERLTEILGDDGKLHGAPNLMVEVVSPGWANERRDRETKLKLYSRQGVEEYWIADWQTQTIEVYRQDNGELTFAERLADDAILSTPLLPGFEAPLRRIFSGIHR